jgi:hypothetical protein
MWVLIYMMFMLWMLCYVVVVRVYVHNILYVVPILIHVIWKNYFILIHVHMYSIPYMYAVHVAGTHVCLFVRCSLCIGHLCQGCMPLCHLTI